MNEKTNRYIVLTISGILWIFIMTFISFTINIFSLTAYSHDVLIGFDLFSSVAIIGLICGALIILSAIFKPVIHIFAVFQLSLMLWALKNSTNVFDVIITVTFLALPVTFYYINRLVLLIKNSKHKIA